MKKISIDSISVFVFDFDGVLTNNLVNIDQHGIESVSCSRADGLAFDVLKKLGKSSFILSTEENPCVAMRAKKIKTPVMQGIADKTLGIQEIVKMENCQLKDVLYVGNDLNDYRVMELCGFSVCPSDSHPKIREVADIVLKTCGGNGVVRELIEDVLNVDFIKVLY